MKNAEQGEQGLMGTKRKKWKSLSVTKGPVEMLLTDQKNCREGAFWTPELTQKNNAGSKEGTDVDHEMMKHN